MLLAAKLIIILFIFLLLNRNLLESSLHYNMLCCQRFSRTNFCKWVRCSRSPPNLPQTATICKTARVIIIQKWLIRPQNYRCLPSSPIYFKYSVVNCDRGYSRMNLGVSSGANWIYSERAVPGAPNICPWLNRFSIYDLNESLTA